MDTEFTVLVQAILREADTIKKEQRMEYGAVVAIFKAFSRMLKPFGVFYYDEIRKQHVLDRLEKGTIYCQHEQEGDGSGGLPL